MTQCAETCIAVCCYQGDAELVKRAMPIHQAHGCDIVCLSPADSPVTLPIAQCQFAGERAYIGEKSLQRQLRYFEILLKYPHEYFLINDSDSFFLAAKFPDVLYADPGTIWSNEVPEPRPHASPYPKVAMQPPYWCHRDAISRMLGVAGKIECHPVTPYVDWFMLALASEAGLKRRRFTDLEHEERCAIPFSGNDSWAELEYHIRHCGAVAMHPIKFQEHVDLCVNARKFYEHQL